MDECLSLPDIETWDTFIMNLIVHEVGEYEVGRFIACEWLDDGLGTERSSRFE